MERLRPSSPTRTTTNSSTPVEIPHPKLGTAHISNSCHNPPRFGARHGDSTGNRSRPRPRDVRRPNQVPQSVASLLAVTTIPPHPRRRNIHAGSKDEELWTVDAIIEQAQVKEKTLSLSLARSPMELLLSAPEDLEDDDFSISESVAESSIPARRVSLESSPSLVDSVSTSTLSSIDTPSSATSRRCRPTRLSREPITAPGEGEEHPLFSRDVAIDELDFRVFEPSEEPEAQTSVFHTLRPLKSAFKSNLTASLKALKSAAKSFGSLNFTSISPEDFLTRSLLAIDPKVPYMDERRPPVMETEPPAALRRYLNPTSFSLEDSRSPAMCGPATRSHTASIQMQTYKVHHGSSTCTAATKMLPAVPLSSTTSCASGSGRTPQNRTCPFAYPPGSRALRENSDFIRVAVMEMTMRRRGKLSDETAGHARLALPPRRTSLQPYEVGADGVPLRWVPISAV